MTAGKLDIAIFEGLAYITNLAAAARTFPVRFAAYICAVMTKKWILGYLYLKRIACCSKNGLQSNIFQWEDLRFL